MSKNSKKTSDEKSEVKLIAAKATTLEKEEFQEIQEIQEVEALQDEIDEQMKRLQDCLKNLEYKKRLSENRAAFIEALDKLEEAGVKLAEEETFDTKNYRLSFEEKRNYREEEIFGISTSFILQEFVKFMAEKVREKIKEIELSLITA